MIFFPYFFLKYATFFLKLITIFSFIFFSACDDDRAIKTYNLPKQKNSSEIIENKVKIADLPFTWNVPIKWKESQKSPMRIASYDVPFSGGYAEGRFPVPFGQALPVNLEMVVYGQMRPLSLVQVEEIPSSRPGGSVP